MSDYIGTFDEYIDQLKETGECKYIVNIGKSDSNKVLNDKFENFLRNIGVKAMGLTEDNYEEYDHGYVGTANDFTNTVYLYHDSGIKYTGSTLEIGLFVVDQDKFNSFLMDYNDNDKRIYFEKSINFVKGKAKSYIKEPTKTLVILSIFMLLIVAYMTVLYILTVVMMGVLDLEYLIGMTFPIIGFIILLSFAIKSIVKIAKNKKMHNLLKKYFE